MYPTTKYYIINTQNYRDVLSCLMGKWWNTRYIVAKLTVESDIISGPEKNSNSTIPAFPAIRVESAPLRPAES